ncbi:MAG: metallophosphoesterase [Elusimicrobiota bacterium]
MTELLSVQVFLAVVTALFYIEARLLLHAWLHRRQKPRPGFWPRLGSTFNRRFSRIFHTAAVFGAGCILYGFFIEPSWIEVKTVRLSSPGIFPSSGPIRIVHLSDLHSEAEPLNEPAAMGLVNSLKPDIVVVTGDYLNTTEGIPVVRRMLSALTAPYGVFCITGNYDLQVPAPGLFNGLPVRRLDKSAAILDIRGTKIRVIGLEINSGSYFKRLMADLGPSPGYDVLLHHYSDLVYEADKAGIDLYLSGHTHGGQIRLPFYGALITLATFGKRFESGLYRVGRSALYVNRGLGMEGGIAPKVRFLCRPEITVFEISAGKNH